MPPTSYVQLSSNERLFGENALHLPRPDAEIRNPYGSDGLVEDWETAAHVWKYAITSRLLGPKQSPTRRNGLNEKKDENGDTVMDDRPEGADEHEDPLTEHPLLMSEAAWNPSKNREKTMETVMEGWGVPAFFLAKNGQLAAWVSSSTVRADVRVLTRGM